MTSTQSKAEKCERIIRSDLSDGTGNPVWADCSAAASTRATARPSSPVTSGVWSFTTQSTKCWIAATANPTGLP